MRNRRLWVTELRSWGGCWGWQLGSVPYWPQRRHMPRPIQRARGSLFQPSIEAGRSCASGVVSSRSISRSTAWRRCVRSPLLARCAKSQANGLSSRGLHPPPRRHPGLGRRPCLLLRRPTRRRATAVRHPSAPRSSYLSSVLDSVHAWRAEPCATHWRAQAIYASVRGFRAWLHAHANRPCCPSCACAPSTVRGRPYASRRPVRTPIATLKRVPPSSRSKLG